MHSSRSVGFAFLVTVAIAFGFLALARTAEALIYFGYQDEVTYESQISRSTFDGGSVEEDFLGVQPEDDVGVGALAADGRYIYWGDRVGNAWTIGRAEVDGSNVDRTFIENIPCCHGVTDLEVGGGGIFWLAGDYPYIGRANADGSGAQNDWRATSFSNTFGAYSLALTPSGDALFAHKQFFRQEPNGDTTTPSGIYRIDPSSGAATLIADLDYSYPPAGIAANATHVYFAQCRETSSTTSGVIGAVGRVPVEGGTVERDFFVPNVGGEGGCHNGVVSVNDADASRVYINWSVAPPCGGLPPSDCPAATFSISALDIASKAVHHVIPNRSTAKDGVALDDLTEFPLLDSDGDGVPDRSDKCPKHPGKPKADGCPLIDRSISLFKRNDKMVGRVDAGKRVCERGVIVRLERKGSSGGKNAKTNRRGKYVRRNVTRPGKYRAEVSAEQVKGGICRKAKSDVVRIPRGET